MAHDENSRFSVQTGQDQLWDQEGIMTEKELLCVLIDRYTDLQRIKTAPDKEKEIRYQIAAVKAKLEAFDIETEILDVR